VGFAAGKAFVVCSQLNQVKVYDLANLDAAPTTIDIAGEDPRALTVSPDGKKIYVAIFESGNQTTVVPFWMVDKPEGPYGGMNPVPDYVSGLMPSPMLNGPRTSLIVKKDATGKWRDLNGEDWSNIVTWDLHDHDVAVIDTSKLTVNYITGLMNLNMAIASRPDGAVAVVGTDATNEVRFEPMLTGRFVHSKIAYIGAGATAADNIVDLNPHLATAYLTRASSVSPAERAKSLADPRGVVWAPNGQALFVTGLGSNNVAKLDAAGNRLGEVDIGEGPTGLVYDAGRNRLYALSKFAFGVSTIDPATMTETSRVALYDPTPEEIRAGRPFLYDARRTSGLGVTACGACHVDARMDQIGWDLGNPATGAKAFDQTCDNIFTISNQSGGAAGCDQFHPIKGPMVTQTLQGIIGTEPLHWRGDRKNLAEFNPAFVGLDGADRQLTDDEMAKFEAFLATIHFGSNPFRGRDNSLPEHLGNGDPRHGREVFMTTRVDGRPTDSERLGIDQFVGGRPLVSCNRCHEVPTGTNHHIVPGVLLIEPQAMKVPQLRNVFEKTGFDKTSKSNNRGYGVVHDGPFNSVEEFLSIDVFHFGDNDLGAQNRRDVSAFVMAFGTETHPAVGWSVTLRPTQGLVSAAAENAAMQSNVVSQAAIEEMLKLADDGWVGLIVRDRPGASPVTYAYVGGGQFRSGEPADNGAQVTTAVLRGAVTVGHERTWTVVPLGSAERLAAGRE